MAAFVCLITIVTLALRSPAQQNQLVINEWLIVNSSILADPVDGQFEPWIEIFNSGSVSVDLSGFYLTDTLTNRTKFVIPSGRIMPAGGFLLVWADAETNQNTGADLHLPFQLNPGGGLIGLYSPSTQAVTSVMFGSQSTNVSEGRWSDAIIYTMPVPTPRVRNVLTSPSIRTQPLSQTVTVGSNVLFRVVADGSTPFSYQWQKDGISISGATNSTFNILNAQPFQQGVYTATVSNPAGQVSTTSATLTVLHAPLVRAQPQSQTVMTCQSVTFSVDVIGASPLRYQWMANGALISGATNSSYLIPNVSLTDHGTAFNVGITNTYGAVVSSNAVLQVAPDQTAPTILQATRSCYDWGELTVTFNEPLLEPSAVDVANYSLGGGFNVTSAVLLPTRRTVRLSTFPSLTNCNNSILTVTNIQDLCGNAISTHSIALIEFPLSRRPDTNGLITVEAEDFDHISSPVNNHSWVFSSEPFGSEEFSDAGYMRCLPNTGLVVADHATTNSPRLDYCIYFPSAGRWYIWLRGNATNSNDNSAHVGLNGTMSSAGLRVGDGSSWGNQLWQWVNNSGATQAWINVPSAGLHTLNIWAREDGLALDRIMLTANSQFVFPDRAAIGPPSSPSIYCDDDVIVHRNRCRRTSKGTDFWLTFPGNYDPNRATQLTLTIVGPPLTVGRVEMPKLMEPFRTVFVISGQGHVVIPLPLEAHLGNAQDLVGNNGIHVTASREVSVFGLNYITNTTDGYLALPTDTLGTNYFVLGYSNVHLDAASINGSQFAIVASEDSTSVQIIPSTTTGEHVAAEAYPVILDRGQTYQLRNTNGFADLTGTYIESDKPIAVFGGHNLANVPNNSSVMGNHMVEQLLPIDLWGRDFAILPSATRTNGDVFRVIAASDQTIVTTNANFLCELQRGQFYEWLTSTSAYIHASAPVMLAQYSTSARFDGRGQANADPFMTLVPATNHWLTNIMVWTPTNDHGQNWQHFLNVVGLSSNPVTLDDIDFLPASGPGLYSALTNKVDPGLHFLHRSASFTAIAYGYAQYDAYGYPAGMSFYDTIPPSVICPTNTNRILPAETNCVARIPDLRPELTVFDDCSARTNLTIDQIPAPGTVLGPGVYFVGIVVTDEAGNSTTCSVHVTIEGQPSVITCPTNRVVLVACTNEGAVVFYDEPIVRTTCGSALELHCEPPSGNFFRIGTNIVSCGFTNGAGFKKVCEFMIEVRCTKYITVNPGPLGLTMTWLGDAALETAPNITGPWVRVTNAISPHRVNLTAPQAFYRLR